MAEKYDFSGYATKNDLKCADGRTIRKNAFKDCDGTIVPLVWQHAHGDPGKVLGHALLENRDDGVYTYGSFNETEAGKNAKELVRHRDVKSLSIYANQLIQKGGDVLHGMIREVSLCLAGANPGAVIEDLSFGHYDDDEEAEFEARIFNGENIELYHSEEMSEEDNSMNEERSVQDIINTMDDDQRSVLYDLVEEALAHADNEGEEFSNEYDEDRTIQDVIDTMNPEQKEALTYIVDQALNASQEDDEADEGEEVNEEDESEMMQHAYENQVNNDVLIHDAMNTVIQDGKRFGSLKESYNFHLEEGALAHAIDTTGMDLPTLTNAQYANSFSPNAPYGINEPSMLYPEAKNLNVEPEFIKRDTDWVSVVWNNVHRTPFSRIKSVFANITEDEARAKGYIKGNLKKEEFFSLMKRVTVPQTVYKKQKLDRDDIIDITDFDIVRWIRAEMRVMWDEETARAMLIGDGRTGVDADKISEEHIRPIASDKPLFSIQVVVPTGATEEATAKNFMKAAVLARKDYRGSGNPMLFTTEEYLTRMLLIEDGIGHYIYKSEAELATALRVSRIVTVPVMEGHKLANGNELMGIIVNLKDYNVGTDKGGEVNLFDDFDIDYNQYKYLIESRCSGALIKPYSAIVLSKVVPAANGENHD